MSLSGQYLLCFFCFSKGKGDYVIAVIPGRDGCLAAKMRHRKELVDFAKKWVEKEKG